MSFPLTIDPTPCFGAREKRGLQNQNSNQYSVKIAEYISNGFLMNDNIKESVDSLIKNSLFSSRMILNLVNDLLDQAKMENQAFNLHSDYFNLFEIIHQSFANINF